MKFMKRANIYQCSNYNCTFDPATVEAHSYRWWRFVAVIDGLVIFNSYRYSNSTSKHQRKVRSLMYELGIKIDLELPLPRGIRAGQTLAEMILEAEETVCDRLLNGFYKQDQRNERSRLKRLTAKLENYLENTKHFRDYDIVDRKLFANPNVPIANKVAVHQCVDAETLERDVENALYNFHRDGFGSVVFYVGAV